MGFDDSINTNLDEFAERQDVEIPDDQAEKLKTVQDVINFVTTHKK